MALPDAVDHDPRRERMRGTCQPERELLAVARAVGPHGQRVGDTAAAQGGRQPRMDDLFLQRQLAAVQQPGVGNQLGLEVSQNRGRGHVEESLVFHPVRSVLHGDVQHGPGQLPEVIPVAFRLLVGEMVLDLHLRVELGQGCGQLQLPGAALLHGHLVGARHLGGVVLLPDFDDPVLDLLFEPLVGGSGFGQGDHAVVVFAAMTGGHAADYGMVLRELAAKTACNRK